MNNNDKDDDDKIKATVESVPLDEDGEPIYETNTTTNNNNEEEAENNNNNNNNEEEEEEEADNNNNNKVSNVEEAKQNDDEKVAQKEAEEKKIENNDDNNEEKEKEENNNKENNEEENNNIDELYYINKEANVQNKEVKKGEEEEEEEGLIVEDDNVQDPDAKRRLFIPHVHRSLDENDIRKYFEKFGVVKLSSISSKRFGFITMDTTEATNKILSQTDPHKIGDIILDVNRGLPRTDNNNNNNNKVQGNNRIFVNGIPRDTSDVELKEFFSRFGVVEDAHQPGNRGYGFVTYGTNEEVENILKENKYDFKGAVLRLERAKPRQTTTPKRKRSNSPHRTHQVPSSGHQVRLYVRNIPEEIVERDLRQYFQKFVKVDNVFFPNRRNPHIAKFGFVTVPDEESLQKCLSMTHTLNDVTLQVNRAKPPAAQTSDRYRRRSRSPPYRRRRYNDDRRYNNDDRGYDRYDNNRNDRYYDRRYDNNRNNDQQASLFYHDRSGRYNDRDKGYDDQRYDDRRYDDQRYDSHNPSSSYDAYATTYQKTLPPPPPNVRHSDRYQPPPIPPPPSHYNNNTNNNNNNNKYNELDPYSQRYGSSTSSQPTYNQSYDQYSYNDPRHHQSGLPPPPPSQQYDVYNQIPPPPPQQQQQQRGYNNSNYGHKYDAPPSSYNQRSY